MGRKQTLARKTLLRLMRWSPLRRRVVMRKGLRFNVRLEPLQRVGATIEETVVKIAPLARLRLRGVVRQRSGSRDAHPALAIAFLKAIQGHPTRAHADAVRSRGEPRLRRKQNNRPEVCFGWKADLGRSPRRTTRPVDRQSVRSDVLGDLSPNESQTSLSLRVAFCCSLWHDDAPS
jgi:hypothetical protein